MTEKKSFSASPKGVYIRVKAKPGAHADAVLGSREGELLVTVRAQAEKGLANAAIARLLAKTLGVPTGSVILKAGGSSRHKIFELPRVAIPVLEKLGRNTWT